MWYNKLCLSQKKRTRNWITGGRNKMRAWRVRKRLARRRWIRQRARIKRFLTSYIKLIWRTFFFLAAFLFISFLDILFLWNYRRMCGSDDKIEGPLAFLLFISNEFVADDIKEWKMLAFEIFLILFLI